jgi:hypothetical protein
VFENVCLQKKFQKPGQTGILDSFMGKGKNIVKRQFQRAVFTTL